MDAKVRPRNTGKSKHPLHKIWHQMIARCHRPSCPNYHYYGARGITVCDEWRNDFYQFVADMGPRPTPKHQLDRQDNDKGYSPDNCRWASKLEQMRNRRSCVYVTINGERLCVAEWAARLGVDGNLITYRIRRGWDAVRAVTTPIRHTGKKNARIHERNSSDPRAVSGDHQVGRETLADASLVGSGVL